MKKSLWIALILMLICILSFSACDGESQPQTPNDTPSGSSGEKTEPDDETHLHSFSEWIITKNATCTVNGEEERSCSCGEKETKSIVATGHTEVIDAAIVATCTTDGKTEGKHCSVCNETILSQNTIPASHTNGEWIIDINATCTKDGSKHQVCSVCSATIKTEIIKSKGHTASEWLVDTAATCLATGSKHKECTVCHVVLENGTIEKIDHTTVIDAAVEATCTTAGLTEGLHCSVCNTVLISQQTVNPYHKFDEEYEFNSKYHWRTCTVCSSIDDQISHNSHSNGNCDMCGIPVLSTDGVLYDVSSDGKYAEVIGYTGTATKVKIANEYQGLPVQAIYKEAFKDNKNITIIVIPDSVLYVRNSAFYNCTALSNIIIGDNVAFIEDMAFYNCRSLETIIFGKNLKNIWERAFANCTNLTNLVFGENLVEIENFAFSGCSNLTDIVLNDNIEIIGDYAFSGCTELSNIDFPDTIQEIGAKAFSSSSNILSEYNNCLYVGTTSNPYFALVETINKNFSTYTMHEDCKIIAVSAFNGCSRLSNINIQNGVLSIGEKAFYNCSKLTDIVIPDSVNYIGDDALKGCMIKNATLPAFAATHLTSWIENVVITSGTRIFGAFDGCSSLKKVVLADTVTTLTYVSFQDCQRLQEIFLPDSITEIHNKAFNRCFELTFINIPDKVTIINPETFASCKKLKSIIIGSGVETIYFDAFTGCESLDTIYYKGTSEEWNEISISYSGNSKLISATRYYYSEQQPTEDGLFWHYGENGEIEIWD